MKQLTTFLLAGLLCAAMPAHAQLQVTDSLGLTQMLTQLFGPGVQFGNLQTTCDTAAMGYFDGTNSSIGLQEGILLSTGKATDAENQANALATHAFGSPGNADLEAQLPPGSMTNDACVLEFDISAVCDTIVIRYVFASEEYPTFVGSFNDAFAFFIEGPGYLGMENIAMVPGTTLPVAINNINASTNPQYYVDNLNDSTVAFNAFTVPLTAYAVVVPDSTYHMTLVVADVLDQVFDTGIFLQREGVCANPRLVDVTPVDGNQALIAEDGASSFRIRHALPAPADTYVHLSYEGTATPGVDYVALPDSFLLSAGSIDLEVPIQLLSDCEVEGEETLRIIYENPAFACAGQAYADTFELRIEDLPAPLPIDLGADTILCSGETLNMGVTVEPELTYLWTEGTVMEPNAPATSATLINDSSGQVVYQTFVLTASDALGCTVTDSLLVGVSPGIDFTLLQVPDSACLDEGLTVELQAIHADQLSWTLGDGTTLQQPSFTHIYQFVGTYEVSLNLSNAGCERTETFHVVVEECEKSTGLAELLAADFLQVYPNPASDLVQFRLKEGVQGKLLLLDATGRTVWQQSQVSGELSLSLQDFARGVYTVQLRADDKQRSYLLQVN
ncbi:MAG: choice-of-anchor L domain-containing protein [Bacteroidota bacterium]